MKKISTIVFFTLLFMQGRLWPQDLVSRLCAGAYAVDDATMITFSAKSFDIHARNTAGKETVTSYPVIYSVTGQNLYLRFEPGGPVPAGMFPGRQYLTLFGDTTLLFYDGDGRGPALIASGEGIKPGTYFTPSTASSALRESSREYTAEHLDTLLLGVPWVEGVKGPGIGQGIALGVYASQLVPKSIKLFIVNGYVSFDRPDLFLKNNRIKTLEVFEGNTKLTELTLVDSAQLQTFDLAITGRENLRFVIAAVYPGAQFDDTCLTLLYPLVTSESHEALPHPED
jgi:hypothetical protein